MDRFDQDGNLTGHFKVMEFPEVLPGGAGWGGGTSALDFDGEHIWVALSSLNTVTKVTQEGQVIKEVPVGEWPSAVLYDGLEIWVANFLDDSVTRIAKDGTVLDTIQVERGPHALILANQEIWVGNFQGDSITRIRRR